MAAKKTKNHKSIFSWKNLSLLLILGIVVVGGAFLSGIPQQKYKEKTLKEFYEKLVKAEKNFDTKTAYDSLTYEQKRIQSYEEYEEEKNRDRKPVSMDITAHSYTVDGDRGLIDRTLIACFTEDCIGDDKFEQRAVKEYLFINGDWYTPSENDNDEEGNVIDQNWPTTENGNQ